MSNPAFGYMRDPSLEAIPAIFSAAYANRNNGILLEHNPFSEHISLSHEAIRKAARLALDRTANGEPREALILGAGYCLDIPLPEIVDNFDRTTLVDINPEATAMALSGFTPRELGKITLIGADVTGIMGDLGERLQSAEDDAPDRQAFITKASDAINKLVPHDRQPDLKKRHAFVCSQLLMSQLGSIPFLSLNNRIEQRYGKALTLRLGEDDEPLILALNQLGHEIQKDHIRYLSRLVAQSGTVHLADTYFQLVESKARPMVFDPIIRPITKEYFDEPTEQNAWWWRQLTGAVFGVVSRTLLPKI